LQGADQQIVAALRRGDLDAAPVSDAERVLLRYVELITRHAWRATADDAQRLREAGWTDAQIAEAVYVTAMFAFFNRVADAFGLVDPQYDTLGPAPPVASSPSALD
jgi:alkylhydroperoxidase family enzyme